MFRIRDDQPKHPRLGFKVFSRIVPSLRRFGYQDGAEEKSGNLGYSYTAKYLSFRRCPQHPAEL